MVGSGNEFSRAGSQLLVSRRVSEKTSSPSPSFSLPIGPIVHILASPYRCISPILSRSKATKELERATVGHLCGLINAGSVNYVSNRRPNCRQCYEERREWKDLRPLNTLNRRRRASLNEISGCVYVLSSLMEASEKLVTKGRVSGKRDIPDVQERGEPLRDEGTQWIFVESEIKKNV